MQAFLTLNGIGHGHLVRTLQAASWLQRSGRKPVVFFQGSYPPHAHARYPGISLPPLYALPAREAQIIADDVAQYARLCDRSIVIEDTHPAPVAWPPDLRRVLVVRPTEFEHMRALDLEHAHDKFLVADRPGSPTWPYSAAETAELLTWERWECVGPIIRRPTRPGIARVRKRLALHAGEQIFVFSMGGGGERTGSGDRARFLHAAQRFAAIILDADSQARLLFVCGPLFPLDVAIPACFETVRYEPDLPSLFAVAAGAIVRPGYNVSWECIAAGTPFIAVEGTTYREPVSARLHAMERWGIETAPSLDRWRDDAWRARYRTACRDALDAAGTSAGAFLSAIATVENGPARSVRGWKGSLRRRYGVEFFDRLRAGLRAMLGAKIVIIRLDDVAGEGPVLEWLVTMCRRYDLRASLEVIPYLSELDGRALARIDADGLLEVCQHGYAHLPGRDVRFERGEFGERDEGSRRTALASLRRGRRAMIDAFGSRFRGGYSAPYDALPAWLPRAWATLGGRYVSWVDCRPGPELPNVQVGLDLRSRPVDYARRAEALTDVALACVRERGHAGVVLDAESLADPWHRAYVESLLDAFNAGGCAGDFASQRVSSAAMTARRPSGEVPQ